MNDYWNDPPDNDFEPPECCENWMEIGDYGCWCPACGAFLPFSWREQEQEPFIEPEWMEESDRMVNFPPKCPHGNEWFACDACDFASDLAYDAAREQKHR